MIIGNANTGMMVTPAIPASAVFRGVITPYVHNSAYVTWTNAPIGTASDTRWVVFFVHTESNFGGYQPSTWTATIGGITATKLLERITNYGSCAAFIAKVPTGTTATCQAYGNAGGLGYCNGNVWTVHDLLSATPYFSSNATASDTNVISTTFNAKKDGVVLTSSGGRTNTPSSATWSGTGGLVEQFDNYGGTSNTVITSGAMKQFTADATGTGATVTFANSFYGIGDLMTLSFR